MDKKLIAQLVAEKFEVPLKNVKFRGQIDPERKYNSNEGNYYNNSFLSIDKVRVYAYRWGHFIELKTQRTYFKNGVRIKELDYDPKMSELMCPEDVFYVVHNYGESKDVFGRHYHQWNYIEVYLP